MLNDSDKRDIEKILKEKETFLEMLNKTLEETKKHNGNSAMILTEIMETESVIGEIKEAIENEDEDKVVEILERSRITYNEDSLRMKGFRNQLTCVQKNDFYVTFDNFNIDEKYVISMTWDDSDKKIYMSVYDYIYEENGEVFKLMKELCEFSRQSIGDILFQYPMRPVDDKFYVIKFSNCKLEEYYNSGFDREEEGCHKVNIVIGFDDLKFVD